MTEFRDLDDFLAVKPIRLPIRGTTYTFPGSLPARTGLILQRVSAAAATSRERLAAGEDPATVLGTEVMTEAEAKTLRTDLFGEAEQQLVDAGLTTAHVDHVYKTLIAWHLGGEDAALAAWESQGEAPAPNRAARRISKATASTTRSPASTSSTSTRAPRKRAAKAAPRGGSSSGSGR